MFTGIIESLGQVEEVLVAGTNKSYWIKSPISHELKIDQSISHDGVCLTVEQVDGQRHKVTAIQETLQKSNLHQWQPGHKVNLERCMPMNGRLDGHIVQGHVDSKATCVTVNDLEGSREFRFRFPASFASLVIEKGSASINGISLTIFNVTREEFSVAIIPYTLEHTNIQFVFPGTEVNIEFDMVGKYITRYLSLQQS
ncbi:riboflavin synthase [Pseudobacter ginsenosidimutans]|uniref:Riboflavin synthase n=1 Tax=Pseudobacter ginsenosidimutans TaxID=661488 RepID=A0A4Q7MMC5_9BACT|nr:riboflavin synthase [Pseudobacter ginsenosidimutans]QEC40225.1 riboflavin synthase [Pseudobacter ginsenosidimutans]RZS69177.1 riboflavin synthase alpha chain [Pseudobacter ginsenosidimutans]